MAEVSLKASNKSKIKKGSLIKSKMVKLIGRLQYYLLFVH